MVGTLGLGGAGDEGDDGGEWEEGGGALEDEEEEGLPFLFLFWSFFFSFILPETLLKKSILFKITGCSIDSTAVIPPETVIRLRKSQISANQHTISTNRQS